jgi:putative NIF3 family GTP cyclohydrolase 1 type 2
MGATAEQVMNILTSAIPEDIGCWPGEQYGSNWREIPPDLFVKRVLYCVTLSHRIEEYAAQHYYDMIVTHHPGGSQNVFSATFHTALDCCEGGHNDQWRDALGIQDPKHFMGTLGWYGKIEPASLADLCDRIETFMERKILGQKWALREPITSVVVCSGLGGLVTQQALATKADCYVLGQAVQKNMRHSGFKAVIETGHTNSEWMGINKIRQVLEPWGIQVDLAPPEMDRFGGEIA